MVYVRYFRSGAEFKREEDLKKESRQTDGLSVRANYCLLELRNDQAADEAITTVSHCVQNKTEHRIDPVKTHTKWHEPVCAGH